MSSIADLFALGSRFETNFASRRLGPRNTAPRAKACNFCRQPSWLEEFYAVLQRKLWCLEMVNFREVFEDIGFWLARCRI